MTIDIKLLVANLIDSHSVSTESMDIVKKYSNDIKSCDVRGTNINVMNIEKTISIYKRRKRSLIDSGVAFYGLDELLLALKKLDDSVNVAQALHENFNFILFFNVDMTMLVGAIVIEK